MDSGLDDGSSPRQDPFNPGTPVALSPHGDRISGLPPHFARQSDLFSTDSPVTRRNGPFQLADFATAQRESSSESELSRERDRCAELQRSVDRLETEKAELLNDRRRLEERLRQALLDVQALQTLSVRGTDDEKLLHAGSLKRSLEARLQEATAEVGSLRQTLQQFGGSDGSVVVRFQSMMEHHGAESRALRHRIVELEAEVSQQKAAAVRASDELEVLRRRLVDVQILNAAPQSAVEKDHEISSLKERMRLLVEDNLNIQKELREQASSRDSIESLNAQLNEFRRSEAEAAASAATLRQALVTLEDENARVAADLRAARDAAGPQRVSELLAEAGRFRQVNNQLEAESRALHDHHALLQRAMTELHAELDVYRARDIEFQERVRQLESDNALLLDNDAETLEEADRLKGEVAQLSDQLAQLSDRLAKSDAGRKELEAELVRVRQASDEEQRALHDEIEQRKAQARSLDQLLATSTRTLEDELQLLRKDNGALTQRVASLLEDVSRLTHAAEEHTSQAAKGSALSSELDQCRRRCSDLQTTVDSLGVRCQRLEAGKASLLEGA
eukprot:TRINITY_DN18701_c0_g1_i1.p1 TRINITY_DN18701_c0_g1~~TRINITY_DN18701_c0_g1_i1.p1  ORF type:complete len:563 (-),score=157.54 TRINITY_DN18701_c0_g1_i1:228-1916(-)